MKVSIGRIVITACAAAQNNGADVAPAIIVRDWSEGGDTEAGGCKVNLSVLTDASPPRFASSVYVFETEAAARASELAKGNPASPPVAWWPTRV